MIKVIIKKEFNCDKNKLWDIITDNKNYSWRSDLSKIDIVDDNHFIEYTKNNYPTYFTIISKIAIQEYKFNIKNTNIKGNWTGLFKKLENKNIEITFIEEIETSNMIMKLLSKIYLKHQQKRYIKDLEQAIKK